MTPADRVAKLLRETRGQPSEGDLRQMVEDVRYNALEEIAAWCDAHVTTCGTENCEACGAYANAAYRARALARERSR